MRYLSHSSVIRYSSDHDGLQNALSLFESRRRNGGSKVVATPAQLKDLQGSSQAQMVTQSVWDEGVARDPGSSGERQ